MLTASSFLWKPFQEALLNNVYLNLWLGQVTWFLFAARESGRWAILAEDTATLNQIKVLLIRTKGSLPFAYNFLSAFNSFSFLDHPGYSLI